MKLLLVEVLPGDADGKNEGDAKTTRRSPADRSPTRIEAFHRAHPHRNLVLK